jgi:hypothetical protein
VIGDVRQNGASTGCFFDRSATTVREVGLTICGAISKARPRDAPEVPCFNEVRWHKSQAGDGHSITAHRDPPLCGGVIAIVTLFGRATFRVWETEEPVGWETNDGDLVILRGNGWPTESSLSPIHEAESPAAGDRMIVTYRYNKGGPGADYFA